MRKSSIFIAALAIIFVPLLSAETEDQKPKTSPPAEHYEIVVTATRLETPVKEVASSISVIPAKALERLRREFVLEALREIPGAAVAQNGGPGGAASIFLRGANSEHTLVLMDGVEINDPVNPARSADLAHLYVENIERIEILRGPQSPLYGSDALAGIVNIITKKGRGAPRWTISSAGGSYGTFTGQAAVSGSGGRLDYSLGLSGFSTRGISAADSSLPGNSEKDGYRNLTFSGRIGVSLKRGFELELVGRSVLAKTDIDNFGGPYGDDPNNRQDYRSLLLKAQMRVPFLENRWEQKLAVSVVDSRRTHENLPDAIHPFESENGLFKGRMLTVDWQNNIFIHPSNTLTAGLEFKQEQGESRYTYSAFGADFPSLFPPQRAATAGFYVQDSIRLAGQLFAAAGCRFDHHSRAGNALTFRLAPAYVFRSTGTKLKASIATGFKSPSLYELYAPRTIFGPIGNEGLKPERVLGWDAGVEQSILEGRLRAGLTYFHNDFKNLIDFSFSQGYINIGKAESKGVEAELEVRPLAGLSLNIVSTYLTVQDKVTQQPLIRRPRNTLSLAVSWDFLSRWNASLTFDHTGKREDMDYLAYPARALTLAPYSLLNVVVSCQTAARLQLFTRLDNILNARYEMVYGYGALGFSVQAGVKVSI
jgi:vitamin B12 transporter